jgi:uncharacterized protein YjbI with pentapeptide repeats
VADEHQLAVLSRGPRTWNDWRTENDDAVVNLSDADLAGSVLRRANLTDADLRNASLDGADLSRADLRGANLSNASLVGTNLTFADLIGTKLTRADLRSANLTEADLSRAELRGVNLHDANLRDVNVTYADLNGATLTDTDLRNAILTHATLVQARLERAHLWHTVLGNVDLSHTLGLDHCIHHGPSIIDFRTILLSGDLPLTFLRGCGLPDRLIDYLPSVLNASPIQFSSCFISYSTANQGFADRLHADLQDRGVRCWFAPHDMSPGRKIHEQIDQAIRVYDRLLLILSKESMSSPWVKTEIAKARKKEVTSGRRVLFPLALVPYGDIKTWEQFNADLGEDTAREIREYFLPDFSEWKTDHDAYQRSFEKVVSALKSSDAPIEEV